MDRSLQKLVSEVSEFYRDLHKNRPFEPVSPEQISSHLAGKFDFKKPVPLETLIDDVIDILKKSVVHVTNPRCFASCSPCVNLAAVIADTLVSMYDPQLASWSSAPYCNEIEQLTLKFLLDRFGFDKNSAFANFTTGAAEANLTAIVAALSNKYQEYAKSGLQSLKTRPLIYISEEGHETFIKSAHITGLGRDSVIKIKSDNKFRMDIKALSERYNKDKSKGNSLLMVVATIGTTEAGAIDPLNEIHDFCKVTGAWMHTDGAWGAAAALSDKLRPKLSGIEKSDSITCDAHKWLSVSLGAGMFFCRHKEAMLKAFDIESNYMFKTEIEGVNDPFRTTMQWSRRFIGLKVFMSLMEKGGGGYGELMDHQAEIFGYLREKLIENNFEILNDTPLPVICFTHEKIRSGKFRIEEITEKLAEQNVWLTGTSLKGVPCLRAKITSFETQKSDADYLTGKLTELLS